MTGGYDFHPEAEIDLDAVWEYIAEDNPEAADRIIRQDGRRAFLATVPTQGPTEETATVGI